ncbi:hypothetical protein L1049_014295 [Liquidambar formosana]|uniref:Uncharacterized protein n=1 Tax=Liquidambar formosana TaxID=63359 RepID=A0AAP0WXJ5_LIQFO
MVCWDPATHNGVLATDQAMASSLISNPITNSNRSRDSRKQKKKKKSQSQVRLSPSSSSSPLASPSSLNQVPKRG